MSEANIVDITPFLAKHQLPLKYQYLSEQYFVPLAHDILESKKTNTPIFVAINGCQGSGKTTLADFLVTWFSKNTPLNSVALSIDDFYLAKQARTDLAKDVHPLFTTRGVPGTHDVALMNSTITNLLAGEVNVPLPRFNKHEDDSVSASDWLTNEKPVDIVILEGWCVGSEPQPLFSLSEPLNELEHQFDKEGVWRRCVNSCLANEYKAVFNLIDYTVMLKAPSFSDVFTWRQEQEQKLIAKKGEGSGTMTNEQLVYFISHFERITRENLNTLSAKANALIELDSNRDISGMHLTSDDTLQPIIFTDLDGTLLDHADYNINNISELLQQLQNAHIPVVFNTSKTFCEVIELKNDLNIQQPFIVENGAAVFIPEDYFELKPIGCKKVGAYWCYAMAKPLSSLLKDLNTLKADYKAHYKLFSDLSSEQISELTGLDDAQARRAQTRDYSDPLYWYGNDELLTAFVNDVEALGYDIKIGGRFIHIAKNTDKSAAQQWLVKQFTHHFRKPLTVIALGDSDNDKQMLEHANIAIIIANPASKKPVKLSHNKARYSQSPAPLGWIEEITSLPCISSILSISEEQTSHG
ncbi:HAD-IIB family hydrolase [Pseudoalteromonas sp. SR43-6]|uniref:HAD-IIB family hydrolase n=1 Tax=unclassified Pseudoalteromonas TaxID=194690 RepID=UPI0015F84BB8|nr:MULTISPECIES: HAD-IIB family hydrolase [unclassified Pseudoalteromonas]MBB1288376.1 HAD-IIB family hydrolase [Pseudoalteromonas sp. SR41-5]MBB1374513.1 HAD-IIB family hydrolase [Pseudoalteromonas sp. SR43-6]MBB1413289.1 HAD-IIB family hydrolase [Pseudoalteromonas sp. SG43-8]